MTEQTAHKHSSTIGEEHNCAHAQHHYNKANKANEANEANEAKEVNQANELLVNETTVEIETISNESVLTTVCRGV